MYCIQMDLPDVQDADIEAVTDGRTLHILETSSRQQYARVQSSFKLPDDADFNDPERSMQLSTHEDGMLNIFVPKLLSV